MNSYTYLALGDSYTIGEQVPLAESFPYQTVQLLRQKNIIGISGTDENHSHGFSAPEIIARTGWTTDELLHAMQATVFSPVYDFVSLLIGVNNQYRGKGVKEFESEFNTLLKRAVDFASGKTKNVFVLSIPDWGFTPFAEGKDGKQISLEIDAYKTVCEKNARYEKCVYIDITTSQRNDVYSATDFLAPDKLHPSGKEYAKWRKRFQKKLLSV